MSAPGRFIASGPLRRLAHTLPLAGLLAGMVALPALALDTRQAERVVAVLEELHEETGDTVYFDEQAALEWYERDERSSRHIAAAGFDRQSWKEAFDETLTGFLAAVPQADIDRMFAAFEDHLAATPQLTAREKRQAASIWEAQRSKLRSIRADGAQHATLVAPYVGRLKQIAASP
ncbi:hypothetical protein [Ancylobacter amanitiformis]|uniref:DUF2059 domain-containing protein n=1 Tax=Ancylobacter amanitiformis TaxID=217069 RepID=A0ABU0LLS5_9HYPH|nr:hypothetical protein [Ancylobacter amanitiformis]MDQ0509610.1 hypothetical protein [Ancylobacter amanitiformis]